MKAFIDFLVFVTIWVVIICVFLYLTHRRTAPRVSGKCCLEVPCSDKCAREHQRQRDLLTVRYGEVVHEIGKIVQAGQELELEPAPGYRGD